MKTRIEEAKKKLTKIEVPKRIKEVKHNQVKGTSTGGSHLKNSNRMRLESLMGHDFDDLAF